MVAPWIRLAIMDEQGGGMQIKVKMSTPLRELVHTACSQLGFPAAQVRFMVDDVRIGPEDTAEELGLEDDDPGLGAIDAHAELAEDVQEHLDVSDRGDVPQGDLLICEQTRRNERERCVLVSAGADGALDGVPAFDLESLAHEYVLEWVNANWVAYSSLLMAHCA